MNNDNKVETAIAGLNCWASYATVRRFCLLVFDSRGFSAPEVFILSFEFQLCAVLLSVDQFKPRLVLTRS